MDEPFIHVGLHVFSLIMKTMIDIRSQVKDSQITTMTSIVLIAQYLTF